MGMVSHELKTPITSLKIYLQILQQAALKDQNVFQQNILTKSLKQVDNMTGMINGFLNVSRLESGQLHLDQTVFDIQTLFAELEDEMKSTVTTHHFQFKPSHSILIQADREKIS